MAHKKGASSSKNGRNSFSKRLGLKKFGQFFIKAGQIILRQRGLTFKPGLNVDYAHDYTLVAKKTGYLFFSVLAKHVLILSIF